MAHSKTTKRKVNLGATKETSVYEKVTGYYNLPVSFSFSRYDANTEWSKSHNPTVDSVLNMMRGQEGKKWSEVEQTYGGRKHGNNSHRIPINNLSKDAQNRADSIRLYENDLFSLRLQGMVRLWGVIEPQNGCFYVIWYDPEHKVYPVST